jgi:hypothetical protein
MAFIPVVNCVMAELRFTLDGQKVENTLYFQRASAWTAPLGVLLGDHLYTWWVDNMAASLTDSLTLDSVHVTDLTAVDGFAVDFVPDVAETGVVGATSVPNNCAICISFRTEARGRTGRGRNYIMGMPQTHVTLNTLDTADGIAFVAAYNALPTVAGASAATWVVVSRFLDSLPRDVGITRSITTVILLDLTIDSQRRRLPGRGA